MSCDFGPKGMRVVDQFDLLHVEWEVKRAASKATRTNKLRLRHAR